MLLRSSSESSVDRHPSNPAAEGFIKVDTEEGLGNEEMSTERGQVTTAAVEAVTTLAEFAEGFLKILMRITGKGLWYVYLGSAVFSSMRANKCWTAGAWLLGGYTFLVGLITGAVGFSKSRKLNRIRREIGLQFDNDAERIYEAFAVDDPSRGMTREEFAAMTSLCTGVGYRNSKGELTASELRKWMNTRFTLL
ncbi:hypothetical protein Pmar_PMAR007564 [Perkinsus marinus ATCC 50983]|uniref:Uncharacterized protein n=1 Tax=Perkinsus marinus (strain ATCC 50983 / TXsc) TaxID=423536 RepID=C5LKC8_PERM5|nr:hypothetical protein Pmar_PMAR007564 [Perkinsus marinus ATCC 50983]EER02810.1 hypothetical protein Pmar_PMAR007564 [Perkinsus marinus ATCC 50983]|eukprot:XP_002770994.1 hypothetical protein Pmar_PMAR007564 [Perkinsus marinus ATCC 50983]